jgi:hypothetical protein
MRATRLRRGVWRGWQKARRRYELSALRLEPLLLYPTKASPMVHSRSDSPVVRWRSGTIGMKAAQYRARGRLYRPGIPRLDEPWPPPRCGQGSQCPRSLGHTHGQGSRSAPGFLRAATVDSLPTTVKVSTVIAKGGKRGTIR